MSNTPKPKNKRFFCFGYGYVCDYLGHALQQQGGWTLSGTTRDEEKRNILMGRRIRTHIFDDNKPLVDPAAVLRDVTHLMIAAPPDRNGAPAFNMHAEDVLKMPNLEWVGYLSTTGVYGDRNGGMVDENGELNPTNARGEKRVRAERQWLSLFHHYQIPVHIFRLSGIYGPGRSALDTIRAGVARRIEKPGHKFNRIHVDDIVNVLLASFANPNPGAAYNLADDEPAPSHEVIKYACELLGMPVPDLLPFDQADLAPMALSFYKDNKHVLNNRIKQELGVSLKYPNFRAGLRGCLEAEKYAAESSAAD